MSTPARPGLKFESITAMRADAERLHRGGFERGGRWDLAMVLDHLAKTMSGPFVEGARNLPWPAGPIARALVRRMVARGVYPTMTIPAMPSIRPTPGVSIDDALPTFVGACAQCDGLPPGDVACPPFGRMPRGDFIGVQLLHGAHHLSFLKPKG